MRRSEMRDMVFIGSGEAKVDFVAQENEGMKVEGAEAAAAWEE